MEHRQYRFVGLLFFYALMRTTQCTFYVENLDGYPGQGYAVSISLGTPEQIVRVIVDTGSSNFAVAGAANVNITNFFNRSKSSSVQCGSRHARAAYQFGSWQGLICQENMRLGVSGPSSFVYVTLIDKSSNFYIKNAMWQGILGLAYSSLALPDLSVVPVLDSLVAKGVIENSFSMSLCGRVRTSKDLSYTGSLSLGSNSKAHGAMLYTKIVEQNFYSIVIDDLKVGGVSLGLECQQYNNPRTFVDSGTTFLSLPSPIFFPVVNRIRHQLSHSNATVPACTRSEKFWMGVLRCPADSEASFFSLFPDIAISFAAAESDLQYFTVTVPPHLYLQSMPCLDSPGHTCFMFSIQESAGGPCILGTVLMEGYDVVFDRANKRIGFAASSCAVEARHLAKPRLSGLFTRSSSKQCQYVEPDGFQKQSSLKSTVIFLSAVAFILLFVLCSWDNCFPSSSERRWHWFRAVPQRPDDTSSEFVEPIMSSSDEEESDVNQASM